MGLDHSECSANIGNDDGNEKRDELDLGCFTKERVKLQTSILDFYVIDFNTSHTLHAHILTPLIAICTLNFFKLINEMSNFIIRFF